MLDLGGPLREKVLASRPVTDMLIYGALITAGLALFVSPFASSWPDGLERVASALGFDAKAAANPLIHSPMADYRVPGIGSLSEATAIAGVSGAAVVFVLSFVLARTLLPRSKDPS
jgi:cobalt/nickel transport protein